MSRSTEHTAMIAACALPRSERMALASLLLATLEAADRTTVNNDVASIDLTAYSAMVRNAIAKGQR